MRATTRCLAATILAIEGLCWGCAGPILQPFEAMRASEQGAPTRGEKAEARLQPYGPAPHRSLHPLLMAFLDFEQRGARTAAAGRAHLEFGVSYTSMYQSSASPDGQSVALFDGEWARPELDFRFGLTDRLEFFAAVPFLYTTSGFLDSFVETYHDAFRLSQGNRDLAPSNRFGVRLVYDGKTIYALAEDRFGLGDIPIGLALSLVEEAPDSIWPGLLARGAVELPTGSARRGFGNGKYDLGVGLVAEKTIGILTVAAGADYTWIRRPDSMKGSGAGLEDLVGAFVSGEVRLGQGLSALAALDYLSQPLSGVPLRAARRDQLMLSLGGAIELGHGTRLRVDFIEDIIQDVSPDFSLRLGLEMRF
ncbi:MAG: DUF3187 family protein [Planctomycetes bacterium]|nr:DUF3187 family protein [Planctomycetota bacterium]